MELDKDFREYLLAQELDATDIHAHVEFEWKSPDSDENTKVKKFKGFIQDVYHRNSGRVIINLTATENDSQRVEFILEPQTRLYDI